LMEENVITEINAIMVVLLAGISVHNLLHYPRL